MEGKVIWYDPKKGFGFILGQDNEEYFLHKNAVTVAADEPRLTKNQPVSFEPRRSKPNWQAISVQVIAGAQSAFEPEPRTVLKRNPFTPQDPVTDPRKFAGRRDVLRSAVDSIFNAKNLLITGARGIGKSSLAYQLLYMTQGDTELLAKLDLDLSGYEFSNLAGDHRCTNDNSLAEVARNLLVTLARRAGVVLEESEVTSTSGLDIKLFQAKEQRTTKSIGPTDTANWFVAQILFILDKTRHENTGVTFLIDEVDSISPEVPLGPFLKAAVEKLRLDGQHSVSFILGGVTGTSTTLLAQHPSTMRLLERIELQKMADEELSEVVELALAETGVEASQKARERMVDLANSFPQPLHLLGYHAFRLDNDSVIDVQDVETAKNFIVRRALRQDYEEKLEKIGRGGKRDVVRAATGATSQTFTLKFLAKSLAGMSLHALQSELGVLVSSDILERHGQYVYSFREPLFEIYCRWVFGVPESEENLEPPNLTPAPDSLRRR
jgi:cold shock CspA family protein